MTLEAELYALAAAIDFPPTPDFATRRWERPPRALPRRRVLLIAALGAAAVPAATLAVSSELRDRLAHWLGFDPGIQRVKTLPPASPVPSVGAAPLASGSVVGFADAKRRAGFPILLPPGLGAPSRVYFAGVGEATQVTLVWTTRPGLPAVRGSNVGLLLNERRSQTPSFSSKLLGPSGNAREVRVGREHGVVVTGADHAILVIDTSGTSEERTRLSGTALIWGRGGLVVRAEAALTTPALVRLGVSLRAME